MPAFVPIVYSPDGSYYIPVSIIKKGSHMVDHDYVKRESLEICMKEWNMLGQVVEPLIHHGFH